MSDTFEDQSFRECPQYDKIIRRDSVTALNRLQDITSLNAPHWSDQRLVYSLDKLEQGKKGYHATYMAQSYKLFQKLVCLKAEGVSGLERSANLSPKVQFPLWTVLRNFTRSTQQGLIIICAKIGENVAIPGVSMEAMDGERPAEREERVEEVREERFRDRDMVEGRHRSTSPRLSTAVTTYCLSPCVIELMLVMMI
ncbi:hypothetical protein E2C01_002456 [Portunus trituberculatus]|uniref:Uncharacterized protein n=1 Tax=Portunus trituberculatus TaxID=210409 RepID=A0A5B7CJZ5_PORTR|nr:hypothetical protein [Portunus trituberculatus]